LNCIRKRNGIINKFEKMKGKGREPICGERERQRESDHGAET
jgi:hypothetical protein